MKLEWNGSDVHSWMQEMANRFGQEIASDCHECTVDIPSVAGEGQITGFSFPMGLQVLLLSIRMKEELMVTQSSGYAHPVHFHFSVSGHFYHELKDGEKKYSLEQLGASLSSIPKSYGQALLFPEGQDIRHAIILVDREEYQRRLDCDLHLMDKDLMELMTDTGARNYFLFRNPGSLAISEAVNAMFKDDIDGYVRAAFVEGRALQLIALEFEQYKGRLSKLKESDKEAIQNAHNILLENLQDPPVIKQLARQVGINQQKLKKGFKELYGLPINQYLRNLRLEKARALLVESEANIKEIAAHVGYSNPSYFSRRFKERYGMLPKNARE